MAAIATQNYGDLSSETSDQNGHAAKAAVRHFKNCPGVADVMRVVCNELVDLATSSFSPYLLVTFALNIPPFGYGLASLFPYTCNSRWLFFNTFLSAMHMAISIYAVQQIRGATMAIEDEAETSYVKVDKNGNTSEPTTVSTPNSWARIRTLLCYDKVMNIYYVFCIVWVIWQVIGTHHLVGGKVHQACNRWVLFSVVCGFLYVGLGLLALVCSLCYLRYHNLQATHQLKTEDPSKNQVLAIDDGVGGASFA
jgi:hypothetical protein